MENLKVTFFEVSTTATMLGFDVESVPDLSVNNPRVFGILVDATILRLTNSARNDG